MLETIVRLGAYPLLWIIPVVILSGAAMLIDFKCINRTHAPDPDQWPNPKKWHYDQGSGEFYRVLESHKSGCVVTEVPYDTRWRAWYKERNSYKSGHIWFTCLTIVALVAFWWSDFLKRSMLFSFFPAVLISFYGTVWFIEGSKIILLFSKIGPKPRRPSADHYGARTPETPAGHPAADDLAY